MGYSIDSITANCYPGSMVLINKFNIRDETKLNEIEAVLSSARYTSWETNPIENSFSFEHYKAIHRFLFSDLYEWAGKIRTVDISKKGFSFCPADDIDKHSARIFSRLAANNYFSELTHDDFVREIVDFYCTTNYLHPFREGNGRTQRLFLTQLIRNAGFDIRFSEIDTELLMIGTIKAAQGVVDLLFSIFSEAITKQPQS